MVGAVGEAVGVARDVPENVKEGVPLPLPPPLEDTLAPGEDEMVALGKGVVDWEGWGDSDPVAVGEGVPPPLPLATALCIGEVEGVADRTPLPLPAPEEDWLWDTVGVTQGEGVDATLRELEGEVAPLTVGLRVRVSELAWERVGGALCVPLPVPPTGDSVFNAVAVVARLPLTVTLSDPVKEGEWEELLDGVGVVET